MRTVSRVSVGAGALLALGAALGYRAMLSARSADAQANECSERLRKYKAERTHIVHLERLMERMLTGGILPETRAEWEAAASQVATQRDGLARVLSALEGRDGAHRSIGNLIRAAAEPYNRGGGQDISAERGRLAEAAAADTARAREEFRRVSIAASVSSKSGCDSVKD